MVAQTAMWWLYEAADEVENVSKKWQKYSEPQIIEGIKRTPSQTKKGAERLFLTFEKEAYLPKRCEKGVGRKKGEKQVKRTSYQVEKKEKTVKTRKTKEKQIE